MTTKPSCAMDVRPAARAAQRLFTANQTLFVIALVFGVAFGIVLATDWATQGAGGYVRTPANDTVRALLLGGLFMYALLFALMDYARRYWIGVAVAAALVMATIIVWAVIAAGQASGGYAENVAAAALIVGPLVLWFGLQIAGSRRLLTQQVGPLGQPLTSVDRGIPELAETLAEDGHAARPRFPRLGPAVVAVGLAGIASTILAVGLASFSAEILELLASLGLAEQPAASATPPRMVDDAATVGLFTLPLWALLLQLGRKLSRPDATSLLEADKRAPIVLLRSFQDDKKSVRSRNVLARVLYWGFGGHVRLEQAIAGELARFGPFVAIGQPGERLPDLGAARAYFSDDEWQAAVRDWIGRARTIVIVGGATQWVIWELQQVIALGKLDRLVLLLPPDNLASRAARWQVIAGALAGSSWAAVLQDIDAAHTIALCQKPGAAEEVIAFTSEAPQQVDYEIAIRLAVYAMHAAGKPEPGRSAPLGVSV